MKAHKIKLTDKRLRPNSLVDFPSCKKVFINKSFDVEKRLNEFVVFDTETTGLDSQNDSVIQLSAVKYKNLAPVESWNTYLNPGTPISDGAAAVNGITNEMLEGKPKINQVAKDFLAFVGEAPIVGYNVDFDLKFMWCAGIDLISGRDIYDVMLSAYSLFPKGSIPNRKLITVAEALGIEFDAHDSLEDSLATGEVLVQICKRYCIGEIKKIHAMSSDDLRNQMTMDYDDQIEYLLKKYGPAKYDYFISEDNLTKNRSTSRTAEGLECHHIDESIIPTLSDPDIASIYSYDYQRKERLVYCNLLEHLLLHIKIGQDRYYENHKTMEVNRSINELITHGVNMLSMQINRLYQDNGSKLRWEQNCYESIKDNYDDYIEMLRSFQYFIVEHVTGLSDLEKPVYIGRSFTDDDTGEVGHIVEITDNEVKIEFEKEYWTYEPDDFVVDEALKDVLNSVHKVICSTEQGYCERIGLDAEI